MWVWHKLLIKKLWEPGLYYVSQHTILKEYQTWLNIRFTFESFAFTFAYSLATSGPMISTVSIYFQNIPGRSIHMKIFAPPLSESRLFQARSRLAGTG